MFKFVVRVYLHRDQQHHRCWPFIFCSSRESHVQHAVATPPPRQTLLIVHIARPPDAFSPLMSEWNAMLTYWLRTLIAVAPPGPAVPNFPLYECTKEVSGGLAQGDRSTTTMRT